MYSSVNFEEQHPVKRKKMFKYLLHYLWLCGLRDQNFRIIVSHLLAPDVRLLLRCFEVSLENLKAQQHTVRKEINSKGCLSVWQDSSC